MTEHTTTFASTRDKPPRGHITHQKLATLSSKICFLYSPIVYICGAAVAFWLESNWGNEIDCVLVAAAGLGRMPAPTRSASCVSEVEAARAVSRASQQSASFPRGC